MMIFVILAAFIAVMLLRDGGGLAPGPHATVLAAIALYVAVAAILEWWNTVRTLGRMNSATLGADSGWRGQGLRQMLTCGYLLGGLVGLLLCGLGDLVEWATSVPLLPEALMIAPFVAAMLAVWWMQYPVHLAMRTRLAQRPDAVATPIWSRAEFLKYNFRFQFLFVAAPLGLILLLHDAVLLYGWPWLTDALLAHGWSPGPDWLEGLALLAISLAAVLVAPAIIVHVWATRPLPAGELRTDLEQALARLRVRCRKILLWESGGVIANAAVIGMLAPLRYVLLSDALLRHMDRREVHAVFAHEAGHILSHHLFYLLLFLVGVQMLAVAAMGALAGLHVPDNLVPASALAMVAVPGFLAFGRISRAFERQSDVIGAWLSGTGLGEGPDADRVTPEGAAVFALALQRIALINGTPPGSPNFRHGSIQSRVSYIYYLGVNGGSRREIDRTVRRIKIGLWALFLLSVAAAAIAGQGLTA
jgi:STE24 endopeptidase